MVIAASQPATNGIASATTLDPKRCVASARPGPSASTVASSRPLAMPTAKVMRIASRARPARFTAREPATRRTTVLFMPRQATVEPIITIEDATKYPPSPSRLRSRASSALIASPMTIDPILPANTHALPRRILRRIWAPGDTIAGARPPAVLTTNPQSGAGDAWERSPACGEARRASSVCSPSTRGHHDQPSSAPVRGTAYCDTPNSPGQPLNGQPHASAAALGARICVARPGSPHLADRPDHLVAPHDDQVAEVDAKIAADLEERLARQAGQRRLARSAVRSAAGDVCVLSRWRCAISHVFPGDAR